MAPPSVASRLLLALLVPALVLCPVAGDMKLLTHAHGGEGAHHHVRPAGAAALEHLAVLLPGEGQRAEHGAEHGAWHHHAHEGGHHQHRQHGQQARHPAPHGRGHAAPHGADAGVAGGLSARAPAAASALVQGVAPQPVLELSTTVLLPAGAHPAVSLAQSSACSQPTDSAIDVVSDGLPSATATSAGARWWAQASGAVRVLRSSHALLI